MVIPRYQLLPEGQDGQFHCVSRCIRRAFFCGSDLYSNQNYDHRKVWIKERLKTLASGFAIDVVAYAIMENHLHTLLWVRREKALSWTDQDVARRWLTICPVRRDATGGPTGRPEMVERKNPGQNSLRLAWFISRTKQNKDNSN